jgi:hypothetical protein
VSTDRLADLRKTLGLPPTASPQAINEAVTARRAAFEKFVFSDARYRGSAAMLLADGSTWSSGRVLDAEHIRWHMPDASDEAIGQALAFRRKAEADFASECVLVGGALNTEHEALKHG